MCDECGCDHDNNDRPKKIEINRSVNEANNIIADQIKDFLKEKEIFCINLLGSPGSGKTTVIEGISKHIDPKDIAVIQGDLESDIDKIRLEEAGIYTYQINTHSGCHLNAAMINKALMDMDLTKKKYLIIENVGNLICPAGVKIGQHLDMVVSSTTEGSDKPKKYPLIFMDSSLVIISKTDLAGAVDFDEDRYIKDITNINSRIKIIKTSSKDTDSFAEPSHYLDHQRKHLLGHSH